MCPRLGHTLAGDICIESWTLESMVECSNVNTHSNAVISVSYFIVAFLLCMTANPNNQQYWNFYHAQIANEQCNVLSWNSIQGLGLTQIWSDPSNQVWSSCIQLWVTDALIAKDANQLQWTIRKQECIANDFNAIHSIFASSAAIQWWYKTLASSIRRNGMQS
jgi:hypothetical protein